MNNVMRQSLKTKINYFLAEWAKVNSLKNTNIQDFGRENEMCRKSPDWTDYQYTDEIVCPYCLYQHKDSWDQGIDEGGDEVQCQNCEKLFYCETFEPVYYISKTMEELEKEAGKVAIAIVPDKN